MASLPSRCLQELLPPSASPDRQLSVVATKDGAHEKAGVRAGLLPAATGATNLFPLLKQFVERGINRTAGSRGRHDSRFHKEDGVRQGTGGISSIHHCHAAISASNSEDTFECALFHLIKLRIS